MADGVEEKTEGSKKEIPPADPQPQETPAAAAPPDPPKEPDPEPFFPAPIKRGEAKDPNVNVPVPEEAKAEAADPKKDPSEKKLEATTTEKVAEPTKEPEPKTEAKVEEKKVEEKKAEEPEPKTEAKVEEKKADAKTDEPKADADTKADAPPKDEDKPEPAVADDPKAKKKKGKTKPFLQPIGPVLIKGRLADLAAIVSGLLYWVAFAGVDIWPLTFICLVPLYLALFGQTPKKSMWLGFLTGLAMNVGGFYWLINMLKTFSGFPTPLCLLFTLIIASYQGGRLALMGWLHGRAAVRGWPVPLVFGAAFIASELVYPLLFPWYYAATVHKVPVLMQLADIGGPILVGVVLLTVNMAIAEPIRAKLASKYTASAAKTETSGPNELRHSLALNKRLIGIGALAILVTLLYGAVRISMTNSRVEKAEQARVGYVQGNMSLMGKRENPGEGLRRHRSMTAQLREKGVDLVVWSETSATFPTQEDLATKQNFFRDRFAASLQVPTIFGAVLYRTSPDHPEEEKWFNTAIGTDAKGEIKGRYDKQYLLAFGEYLPLGETFPILHKWSPHSGRFSPGKTLDPIDMPIKGTNHKISVLICYEDILPGFTNRMVSYADPELLVNMTNDAWFGDTSEPWQHLALAKFRAIEHRRFLVRSTNSGVSAVIDPNGSVLEGTVSTPFKAEQHDAVIRWLRGTTVYEVIGDVPYYLISIAIAVLAFRRKKGVEPVIPKA
jgi:apolipoprotein N-acyltransferase